MAAKAPERMCITCRTRRPQRTLLRVARKAGVLQVDAGRDRSGRGAYVCRDLRCIDGAVKRQAFRRALGGEMTEELHALLRYLIDDAPAADDCRAE